MVFTGPPSKVCWTGDDSWLEARDSEDFEPHHMTRVSTKRVKVNAKVPRCFEAKSALELQHALAWADMDPKKWVDPTVDDVGIHHALVVATEYAAPVEYKDWKELCISLRKGKKVRTIEEDTLFSFYWSCNPPIARIETVYAKLEEAHGEHIRFYPNLREVLESELKIGDIRVLDVIASQAPEQFAYRPLTCSNTSGCTLDDVETHVMKQTHSSCSHGVKIRPMGSSFNHLPCLPLEPRKVQLDLAKKGQRWFHQEKVPSLPEFGEFRVLISTLPNKAGLRGRRGYVFEVVHTKPCDDAFGAEANGGNDVMGVLNRVADELLDAEWCGDKTYKDLEEFALYTFEQLRAFKRQDEVGLKRVEESEAAAIATPTVSESGSPMSVDDTPCPRRSEGKRKRPEESEEAGSPSKRRRLSLEDENDCGESMFESLEVGVRMDIGVSSAENGHRFFVNEVTREWHGDYMEAFAGQPRSRICTAFANARNQYFFHSRR